VLSKGTNIESRHATLLFVGFGWLLAGLPEMMKGKAFCAQADILPLREPYDGERLQLRGWARTIVATAGVECFFSIDLNKQPKPREMSIGD
jgi:hypothetical protein